MSFGSKYAAGFSGIDDHLPPSDHDPLVHERIMPSDWRPQKDWGLRDGLGDTPSASGSVPDMLHRFGINATQAVAAVATMMFTVGGANPAASGTMIAVRGAQIGLNEIAAGAGSKERLQEDGILGSQTLKALMFQIPSGLMTATWLQVYSILRNKIDTKQFKWLPLKTTAPTAGQPNQITEIVGEESGLFTTSNLMIVGGGALLAALFFGGKKSSKRSSKKGRR